MPNGRTIDDLKALTPEVRNGGFVWYADDAFKVKIIEGQYPADLEELKSHVLDSVGRGQDSRHLKSLVRLAHKVNEIALNPDAIEAIPPASLEYALYAYEKGLLSSTHQKKIDDLYGDGWIEIVGSSIAETLHRRRMFGLRNPTYFHFDNQAAEATADGADLQNAVAAKMLDPAYHSGPYHDAARAVNEIIEGTGSLRQNLRIIQNAAAANKGRDKFFPGQ